MTMRLVALVLVLSLTGPAVATAVCEWSCAESQHHQMSEAAEGCHGHETASQVPAIDVADSAPCHHGQKVEPAVTPGALYVLHMPAVTEALIDAVDTAPSRAFVVAVTLRPPGLVPITTTQLRI